VRLKSGDLTMLPAMGRSHAGAYECATALYSICNQRDADRLEVLAHKIKSAESAGDLSADEVSWLTRIVESARQDKWTQAAAEARKIMSDQVE
jgi:hypothetical protein